MTIFAVILVGGQGSRLGHVRKGDLRLGGRTLRQRVSERLNVDAILPTLPDPPGIAGPLAGLVAAVSHVGVAAPDDVLVSVAVDTPFLPSHYVERLVAALGDAHAAYAAFGEQFYPTNAAYRLAAVAHLPVMAAEVASPKRLLSSLGARAVDWSELPADPFANLNTLADLVVLTQRNA